MNVLLIVLVGVSVVRNFEYFVWLSMLLNSLMFCRLFDNMW